MDGDGRTTRPARHAVELTLATTSVALAATAFAPFFAGGGWLVPVVGATLVGVALPTVAAWRRWPAWIVAPACIAALALFDLYALNAGRTLYGLPRTEGLRAVADGLTGGWATMLTVTLPADATADTLAVPVMLGMVAAALGGHLVLRTRAGAALCLPSIVVLVAALGLTASSGRAVTLSTVGVVAALALLLLVRANRPAEGVPTTAESRAVGADGPAALRLSTIGRVLIGLPGIAVVVSLAVAGGAFLPLASGAERADPRALYRPPVVVVHTLSPLVEVRPQLVGASSPLFRVTVHSDTPQEVTRIRLAALESFDGALWTQSGTFVPAGTTLPVADDLGAGSERVTLDVETLGYHGPFLPVVGEPLRVSGAPVALEATSGTLAERADDDASANPSYRLVADVSTLEGVTAAVPVHDPSPGLLTLPEPPDWVREWAARFADAGTTPWERLVALQEELRTRDYSAAARPGHSYGALRRVLDGDGNDPPEPGNAEQYASAFAVIARAMGFPTRVAVGYLLNPETLEGDTFTVRSVDVHAWPEVLLAGYGWVAFDPTNTQNPAGPVPPTVPDTQVNDPFLPPQAPEGGGGTDGDGGVRGAGGVLVAVALTSLYVVVGLVLVLLLVLAGVVIAKLVRRRLRSRLGVPADRVVAAWRETTDRLRELGYEAALSRTAIEVARAARSGPAAAARDELDELAVIVTSAVFAPGVPTSAAARRAWSLEASIRRTLDGRLGLVRRILAWLDPTPLLPAGVHHLTLRRRRSSDTTSGEPDSDAARIAEAGSRR